MPRKKKTRKKKDSLLVLLKAAELEASKEDSFQVSLLAAAEPKEPAEEDQEYEEDQEHEEDEAEDKPEVPPVTARAAPVAAPQTAKAARLKATVGATRENAEAEAAKAARLADTKKRYPNLRDYLHKHSSDIKDKFKEMNFKTACELKSATIVWNEYNPKKHVGKKGKLHG